MAYRVTVDGRSWLTDDLTIDEAILVEEATGESWLYLNPFRSAKHAKAIVVALLSREQGRDVAEKRVAGMTVQQLVDAIDKVDDDDRPDQHQDGVPVALDPPQGEAAPGTTSS